MANSLNEKVAIVTGGGSGIGEGLCRELARRGARVVVADINSAEAGRVAASITGIGGQAAASTVDVSRAEEVTRLVEETTAAYGRLDYMFNNAGFAIGGDFRDLTPEHWHRVLDVDFYGVLHGMQAAYPVMIRQGFGHIVNTSSAAAFFATPGNAPYCAAKYALVGLSLSVRLEGVDLGVKVSCICPGFVRSNVYRNAEVAGMTLPTDMTRDQVVGAGAGEDDGSSPGGPGDPGRRGPQQGADRLPGRHPLGAAPRPLPSRPKQPNPAGADAGIAAVPHR